MSNLYESDNELLNEGLRPFSLWSVRARKILDSWERGEATAGYKTGLQSLDRYIRLVPSELTVLAARPGMGKTALLMQIAGNIVPDPESKERVAIFSAEMSGWSLYMRLACALAEVNMFKLRSRQADAIDFEVVRRCIEQIKNLPLLIDDRSRPSDTHLRAELVRLSSAYTINAMMFDFMELLDSTGRTEEAKVSSAVLSLKEIAKEFNIPVLAISHLSRSVEDRADKFPVLSDLRYSGMIEQIADQVLLMTRPKYYSDKGMKVDMKTYENITGDGGYASNIADLAYLPIAKNRNGETGIVRLGFDGANMRFFDIQRVKLPTAGQLLNRNGEMVREPEQQQSPDGENEDDDGGQ